MDKFPDKNDLPVTEGPPDQKEPKGQKSGGPPPNTVSKELEAKLYSRKLELLLPLRDFSPQERTTLKLLATPQVTPDMVVSALQNLLGTGESPPGSNCNALTHRAGVGCVAWCDIGWWTALFNAGFNAGGHINMPGVSTDYWFGDAYVPSTEHHFEAAGRFDSKPVPGAGEIHYWSSKTSNPGDSHVAAYIHDYDDGTHLNIECNHNNLCEYVRRPNNDSTRAGYCIPVYVSSPIPTPIPAPTIPQITEEHMPTERIPAPGSNSPLMPDGKTPYEKGTVVTVRGTKGRVYVTADGFPGKPPVVRVAIGSGRSDGQWKHKHPEAGIHDNVLIANWPAIWGYDHSTPEGIGFDEQVSILNYGPGEVTVSAIPDIE